MSLSIPLAIGVEHFSEQVELEGRTYTFELRWNDRDGSWYLSVQDANENALASGVKVVVGKPLLVRFASDDMPPGLLIADDTSGGNTDPGFDDLGRRVTLHYFESTESLE